VGPDNLALTQKDAAQVWRGALRAIAKVVDPDISRSNAGESAPSGTRTPNPLIKSKPAMNGMLTCGKAGENATAAGQLDAVWPIL
jgi:hypothetical protein